MRPGGIVLFYLERVLSGEGSFGLRPDQVERICLLYRRDPDHLLRMFTAYCTRLLRFDPEQTDRILTAAERYLEDNSTQLRLIGYGASQRVMREVFGIKCHRILTRTRRMLGISRKCGRPRKPDRETAKRIVSLWDDLAGVPLPARLLAVCEQVCKDGVSADSVWQVIGEHEAIMSRPRPSRKINLLRSVYV